LRKWRLFAVGGLGGWDWRLSPLTGILAPVVSPGEHVAKKWSLFALWERFLSALFVTFPPVQNTDC